MASPTATAPQIGFAQSARAPAEGRPVLVSPPASTQWDTILADLQRLRNLEDDWDGQGARALDPANVERARTWVEEMRRWPRALPPTGVVPGTNGELVLEWRGDTFYLAAEISDPSRLEWVLDLPGQPGQPVKQWDTDCRSLWIVGADG